MSEPTTLVVISTDCRRSGDGRPSSVDIGAVSIESTIIEYRMGAIYIMNSFRWSQNMEISGDGSKQIKTVGSTLIYLEFQRYFIDELSY